MRRKSKQKKSNFVDKPTSEFSTYQRGAFGGAILGGIAMLVVGKKILWGIIGGAIIGGYISYSVNQEGSETTSLKKFKEK